MGSVATDDDINGVFNTDTVMVGATDWGTVDTAGRDTDDVVAEESAARDRDAAVDDSIVILLRYSRV